MTAACVPHTARQRVDFRRSVLQKPCEVATCEDNIDVVCAGAQATTIEIR